MSPSAALNERLRRMPSDIRLEVILADLLAEGISMDEIIVMNDSLFKRNYHRDVEKFADWEYSHSKKKKLCVVVNREGIYDKLPEDLFHQPADTGRTGTDHTIREARIQRDIERSSRLFFLPVENEFYRHRVRLEAEERNFLFETSGAVSGEIFNYLWDLPDFLDNSQKSKVGAMIPVLHTIVGHLPSAARLIGSITGDRVAIALSSPCSFVLEDASVLGTVQLGVNTLLGGRVSELQSSLTITISPESVEQLTAFLPGGEKWVIYEFLTGLLFPVENDILFELDLSRCSFSFIADEDTDHLGRLNYTTTL